MREQQHTNALHADPFLAGALLAQLSDHSLIEVRGADAASFLQGLITTDIDTLDVGDMAAGALLAPQGKIMFDFLVGKSTTGFFLDSRRDMAQNLHQRLSLYKLRSQIEIILHDQIIVDILLKNMPEELAVNGRLLIFKDKRFVMEGDIFRLFHFNQNMSSAENAHEAWHKIRVEQGIAESGIDFDLGDVFPHDVNFDQIGGVSFKKGCYIGQEVVSRMHHRSTARRRLLLVEADTCLPPKGSVIEAAGKPIGTICSHIANRGLALVRLDRAKAVINKAWPITVQNPATKQVLELKLSFPPSVHFTWPEGDG